MGFFELVGLLSVIYLLVGISVGAVTWILEGASFYEFDNVSELVMSAFIVVLVWPLVVLDLLKKS